MSRQSDELFRELCKNTAFARHLNRYLEAVELEEKEKLGDMAEAALFDEERRQRALVQFGRVQMLRGMRYSLTPYCDE